MKRWPLLVAVILLGGAWELTRSLSHAELIPLKKPFASFPLTIGQTWQGKELGLERDVLNVLKLDDYMMRVYVRQPEASGTVAGQELLPVWLYVGYYQSQRTGATYHSPKNCLPGAGWQVMESQEVSVPMPGRTPAIINKVMVQKGLDKQVILYWYQDRGRVIASEYWAKGYLMWDALTRHRSDGALVRISMPVATTVDAAYQEGMTFLQDGWPVLQAYLPIEQEAS
jgi:EpsI family protein